jgi:multiple sugar transport system substrate-binding protein
MGVSRRSAPGRGARLGARFAVTAAVCAAMLAVSACTGGSGTSSSSARPSTASSTSSAAAVTIVWSASPLSGTGGGDPQPTLISAFEQAYPGIRVVLVSGSADTSTDETGLAGGIIDGYGTPDVFLGDVTWPGQFGARGLAVPLSKYLPASYWDQFAPGLVQGASYKGQVYGSPLIEDEGLLYYRKDLLARAGLPVPQTWEQLETEADDLERGGLVQEGFVWGGAAYEGLTSSFLEYLTDTGGTVTSSDYSAALLDTPAAVKAVSFMIGLVSSGPSLVATEFQDQSAMSNFIAGEAAFLRGWASAYNDAGALSLSRSPIASQVGVAPLPTFAGEAYPGYSTIGGWDMYINPRSAHLTADLTFIRWLSSPAAQDILAEKYGFISPILAVQSSPAVIASSPVSAVAPKTKLVSRPAGTPAYPQLSAAIYDYLHRALATTKDPSTATSDMQVAASFALSSASSAGP